MNLNDIKTKVEELGYIVSLIDESLTVGVDNGTDSEFGWQLLKNAFGIYIEDEKMIIDYAIGQISKEESFSNIKEGVDFIKSQFPCCRTIASCGN